ncbi:MAG: 50S ribosomal protein L4 [Candidatus Aenigmarchaeota archaeon]|nr:50S ribosomal protein L4 [Candidatus Aenigmarchaeota archaeon]
MKVNIFNLQGNVVGEIDLPKVFQEQIREDLIARAVLAIWAARRQPYGVDVMAGKRTSAHYHGVRRARWTMMGRDLARLPRLHGKIAPHLMWRARFAPMVKGGRRAHPPKVEKIWRVKINKKERRKAIRSAIASTACKECVLARGHKVEKVEKLPIVVDDEIQKIKKTKDLAEFLKKINLSDELERIKVRKIRAGRGKVRGRRYKIKKGPLIVVSKDEGISKAARNLPGIDVCLVKNLNAELLAPGTVCGRLTIFSRSAMESLK